MNFLFAACAVIWVLLFLYVLSVAQRQKKVQDDLAQIKQWIERNPKK